MAISDTHFQLMRAKKIIESKKQDIAMILHMGDNSADAREIQRLYPNIPVHYVVGNCDYDPSVPKEKIVEVKNKKIMITHGHHYDVKYSYQRISYAAEEKGVDAVLFGHTHVPEILYHGTLLVMNPGSLTFPRGGTGVPTYGMLEINDEGQLDAKILEFKEE